MQHVESAAVSGKPGAFHLHATESAHIDMPVRLATPGAAPVLELGETGGTIVDKILDDVLIAQPVAAGHRIVKMIIQAVVVAHNTGGAALRGYSMAAHRIDFGDQSHAQ